MLYYQILRNTVTHNAKRRKMDEMNGKGKEIKGGKERKGIRLVDIKPRRYVGVNLTPIKKHKRLTNRKHTKYR